MSGCNLYGAELLMPSFAVWSLIFLALIGANLPFINQRLFALIPLPKCIPLATQATGYKSMNFPSGRVARRCVGTATPPPRALPYEKFINFYSGILNGEGYIHKKPLWIRLSELVICYFLLGGLAYLLESGMGNVFAQGWEFYAITACLFIVFAFPGFIFQYLRR